jgi:hypothetical protein
MEIGKRCEVCGKRLDRGEIIGHHLLGRKRMKERDLVTPELCELRDKECEKTCHKLYPGGNPPKSKNRIADFFRRHPLTM